MASEVKSQAISGVAAGQESHIETVYPSIAASAIGRLIGSVCDSLPLKIGGVKLSYLLFGLPMAPFALIGYFVLKVTGEKYGVTNRSVLVSSALGSRLLKKVSLADVGDVAIDVRPGQEFYHAADLHLLSTKGDVLLTLAGVCRPERLRHVLLDSRAARMQNDASLKVIQSRASA